MELIRSFCHWIVAEGGAVWVVSVWFVVMTGQIVALRLHEKGRIADLTLGRALLVCRCFAAAVFSLGSAILFVYASLTGQQQYNIVAGIVGILSVGLWYSALTIGTAIPDRNCGPGG